VKTERRLSKKLKIYCCILIAQFHSIQYCMISVLFVFCELLNTYILIPTWSWIKESFFLHPDVCVYRGERIRAISSRAPSSPLVVLWCLKLYFVRLVHIDSPFSGLRRGFWSPGSGKPKSKERGPGATHIVTFVTKDSATNPYHPFSGHFFSILALWIFLGLVRFNWLVHKPGIKLLTTLQSIALA